MFFNASKRLGGTPFVRSKNRDVQPVLMEKQTQKKSLAHKFMNTTQTQCTVNLYFPAMGNTVFLGPCWPNQFHTEGN